MSSTSRYDVILSGSARNYLLSLTLNERQSIARSLLAFYKDGTPPHSRPLKQLEGEKYDRSWTAGKYEILYRFLPDQNRVEVGVIRPAGA